MKILGIKLITLKILIIVVVSPWNKVFAQDPVCYHIGTEELANVDVYSLLYDDETDLLYAGTDRGVYRYAQNKFTALKRHENQNGNSFFQLQKNSKGQIYCCNLSGQIFEIKDNELILFYEYPKNEKEFRFFFSIDKDNNIIATSSNSVRKITPSKKETILLNLNEFKKNHPVTFKNSLIRSPPIELDRLIYITVSNSQHYFILSNDDVLIKKVPYHILSSANSLLKINNTIFYGSGTSIQRLDGKKMTFEIPFKINSKLQQFKNNLYIIENNTNGVHFLEFKEGENYEITELFKDKLISTVCYNRENTLFLGTFKEGIIIVPNWKAIKQTSSTLYSGIAASPENQVYLSTRKGEVFLGGQTEPYIADVSTNIDDLYYIKGEYNYAKNITLKKVLLDPNFKHHHGLTKIKDLHELYNEMLILNLGYRISIILKDTLTDINEKFAVKESSHVYYLNVKENRYRAIGYLKADSSLFFSTNFGLFSIKWNSTLTNEITFENKKINANSIDSYKNQMIVGTEDNGILFFKNGRFNEQITLKNSLISKTIIKIKVKDNLLFILTKDAMQVFNLELKTFLFGILPKVVGTNHVFDFALSEDKLWLLDKDGYYSINISELDEKRTIGMGNIFLDSALSNGIKIDLNTQQKFSYNQKEIQFFFDYRDIETKKETQFWYKLEGAFFDDWKIIQSSVNSISFPILPIGNYTFHIKAKYQNKETETIKYSFEIPPPFWRTWWFIFISILVLIFIISIFFYIRIRRIQRLRRIEMENQKLLTSVLESQLKAIRSQMNPHFIFNSLNSIQALILRQDTEKSYDYIVMFSNLVRKTLNFSEHDYINLSEEIDFLSIYLQLESLRMKEDFRYSIDYKGQDPIDIPSLLIQPFLENAIHHGLLHKEGKKELKVQFDYSNESASCIIIDNGIGRTKAKEIKKRQSVERNSFSLNATEQRLQILGKQNNKNYSYRIEDLLDQKGDPTGTKVTVNFPFQY